MPRAWPVSFVILLAVIWALPVVSRAQDESLPRSRQNSRTRSTNFAEQTQFAAEPTARTEAKPLKRITRPDNAAGNEKRDAKSAAKPASAAASLWTTFGSLAIIIIVILLIARTWKKHGPRVGGGIPAEAVEVLGKRIIDQRQSLHLVRLGSRILLLGSSPAGLRTLAEVTDPVDVDYLAGLCKQSDSDGTAAQTFRALFNRKLPAKTSQRSRLRGIQHPLDSLDDLNTPKRITQPDLEEAHG